MLFLRSLSAVRTWSVVSTLSLAVFLFASMVFFASFVPNFDAGVFGFYSPELRIMAGGLWFNFFFLFLIGRTVVEGVGLLSSINDKLDDF